MVVAVAVVIRVDSLFGVEVGKERRDDLGLGDLVEVLQRFSVSFSFSYETHLLQFRNDEEDGTKAQPCVALMLVL